MQLLTLTLVRFNVKPLRVSDAYTVLYTQRLPPRKTIGFGALVSPLRGSEARPVTHILVGMG